MNMRIMLNLGISAQASIVNMQECEQVLHYKITKGDLETIQIFN